MVIRAKTQSRTNALTARAARLVVRCIRVGLFASGLLATPGAALAGDTAAHAASMKLQLLPGYLPRSQLPNSLALLPAPPPTGSAAYAEDLAAATSSLALRGTPRWTLAAQDAELNFPAAASVFSCAVQAPITEAGTPVLYRMLRRSLTDAGLATYAAKDTYRRSRPFTVNAAPICTPGIQAALTKDGSYPSGHTAIGWAWALILTELVPERTDAILARGRAFGESRVVCNVHWLSDVQEGRFVGAATVARLHADPMFRADLALAERELAAARANHVPPAPDCAAEAAAMGDHFLQ